jgi:hypothetical protein
MTFSLAISGSGDTINEKIGYNSNDKLLIIHADNIGMSQMQSDLADKVGDVMSKNDMPYLDELVSAGSGDTFEEKKASYYNAIQNLRSDVNEIIVHLGMDDEELKHVNYPRLESRASCFNERLNLTKSS